MEERLVCGACSLACTAWFCGISLRRCVGCRRRAANSAIAPTVPTPTTATLYGERSVIRIPRGARFETRCRSLPHTIGAFHAGTVPAGRRLIFLRRPKAASGPGWPSSSPIGLRTRLSSRPISPQCDSSSKSAIWVIGTNHIMVRRHLRQTARRGGGGECPQRAQRRCRDDL